MMLLLGMPSSWKSSGIIRRRVPCGPAVFVRVPSMNTDLEVQVLRELGRKDSSEPPGADREGSAEGSGERIRGPRDTNRIAGSAEQGERARDREALTTKAQAL